MKLKKLHVENYGGLCGLDMTFDTGINEVFESNGYGKTTIASFIKASFTGLRHTAPTARILTTEGSIIPFRAESSAGT